ncbi:MAG TPA: GNAT family N-acetyltransferase [Chloroflexi bacterium]|nr:GNAT family N-acetyltransferase [Chloroflexota bacterium]
MLPFTPTLFVRPLTPADIEAVTPTVNRLLAKSIYSRMLTVPEVQALFFGTAAPDLYPVRWQQRTTLALLRVGDLIGLLDAAVGLDSDSLDLPDYQPLGLLRWLALPEEVSAVPEAMTRLLTAAESFWRRHRVGRIKAFHPSTGYPVWQAGIGLLPADWTETVQALAAHEFRYVERYYCFACPLRNELFEEEAPHSALTLVMRGANQDRRYQIFFRRTELIADARVVQCVVEQDGQTFPLAHIVHWEVEERWRNQNIGRWLLRRMVNDAVQQSLAQMIVFVRMQQAAAINLLAQHGFVEQAFRGYVMEKELRA